MPSGQQGAGHGCRQQPSLQLAGRTQAAADVSAVPHLQVQVHNIVAVQIDEAADHVQQQGGTCRQVALVSCQAAGILALTDGIPITFGDW